MDMTLMQLAANCGIDAKSMTPRQVLVAHKRDTDNRSFMDQHDMRLLEYLARVLGSKVDENEDDAKTTKTTKTTTNTTTAVKIGDYVRDMIVLMDAVDDCSMLSVNAIVENAQRVFPGCHVNAKHVHWYAHQLRANAVIH